MNSTQNDDLCSAVLRLNRRLSRKINAALKIHELTVEQAVVLETIAALDCPRVTDLRIALGLDPSTVSANLKPLLKRQFVVITEDVVDRRVRRVKLTPEGEMRLQSSRKILNTMDDAIKQKLAAHGVLEEVVAALRLLSQP
ncbi:MarR family transcriptional regulator [Shinella sp. AETb1-6]|uniref:MarR family winged helix-turn-helix transcriptional regulator n=1 Tax=Shinella sp. AETb1-6 TaxID=2692210 RepID=UPI00136C62ED|nr:MarR family winged helix-turn-helix transcriptional regulator [Shinella sp. AETb1-6]MXN54123.1 MarR family transcriptional regulator [Shinella sp. AETb1-6]